jgi:hypothetical protein
MDEQYEKLIQLYSNWSLCNCCCNNCSKNKLFRFQKCYYLILLLLRPGAYFPFHSSEPTNSSLIRKSPLMTSSPSPHPFHPLRLAAKHLSTSPAALSAPKPELFISCAKEIYPRTSLPWLVTYRLWSKSRCVNRSGAGRFLAAPRPNLAASAPLLHCNVSALCSPKAQDRP